MRVSLVLAALLLASVFGRQSSSAAAAGAIPRSAGDSQCASASLTQDTANRAGLVVVLDDGQVMSFCIEFTSDTITGFELLQRSGLPIVTAASGGLGSAVCSINGVGCDDPGDCFCQCGGGSCSYWVYYQFKDGIWQYSPLGSGARVIRDGDADAWVWGSGGPSAGWDIVCPEPSPTPSPLPSAEPSATPRPTRTPRPSVTPSPSATVSAAPSATAVSIATLAPDLPSVPVAPATTPRTSNVLANTEELGTASPPPARATNTPTSTSTLAQAAGKPTVVRVTEAEGDANIAGQADASNWSWQSTVTASAVVGLLAVVGAAIAWRRRAGV